jgi:hypothetical protein
MSVRPGDVRIYGSANMPDVDGATTGGAVDFTKKIDFSDIATGTMDYISSSGSDTAVTLALTGRDATGVIQTETKTLTGTTKVAGAQSFERLLKGVAGGSAAVGVVAAISHTAVVSGHTCQAGSAAPTAASPGLVKLQSGDGAARVLGEILHLTGGTGSGQLLEIVGLPAVYGTDIVAVSAPSFSATPDATTTYDIHTGFLFDMLPNPIAQVRRPFYNAAADAPGGSSRTFYEKVFAVNANASTALTVAAIAKQTDPSAGTLQVALTNALNDTATVANRQTAPATGITAFTSGAAPQSINVPSPQNLPSGNAAADAQGVWLSLLLAAGQAPAKTGFTLRASGQTT